MKEYTRFLLIAFVLFYVHQSSAAGIPSSKQHIQVKRQVQCHDGDVQPIEDLDCYYCYCHNGDWVCTWRPECRDEIQYKREVSSCSSGEFRKIGCNHCRCINGFWACSRKLCRKSKRDVPECQIGDTKMEECNTCSCAKGHWACTRKLCMKKKRDLPTKVLADLKNVPCSPSDTFFFDCNRCQCNYEKTGYTCVKAQNCTLTT